MPHFCHQISFTTAAWHRVLDNDRDRFELVRSPIESLGGTVLTSFFALDSYDVLLLTEFPDSVSPADISIQFFASGDIAHIHSTRLVDASRALEAAQKSGSAPYRTFAGPRSFSVSAT